MSNIMGELIINLYIGLYLAQNKNSRVKHKAVDYPAEIFDCVYSAGGSGSVTGALSVTTMSKEA